MPRKRKPAVRRTAKTAPGKTAPKQRGAKRPRPAKKAEPRKYAKAPRHEKYEGGRSTGAYNQPAKYDPSMPLNDPRHPLYSPDDTSIYGEDIPNADRIAEGYFHQDGTPMTNAEAAAWNRELAAAAGLPYTGVDKYGTPSNNIPTEFAPEFGHPSSVRYSITDPYIPPGPDDPRYRNLRYGSEPQVPVPAPPAPPTPSYQTPWWQRRRQNLPTVPSPWQLLLEELRGYVRPDVDLSTLEQTLRRIRGSIQA